MTAISTTAHLSMQHGREDLAVNQRQPVRDMTPVYAWTCHVCDTSNPSGQGSCHSCGNAANISIAEVVAARPNEALQPPIAAAHSGMLGLPAGNAQSVLACTPPPSRMPMKRGSIWFCAAGVCGAAVLIAGLLLSGAGGPLLPGAGAPTVTPARWNLPDWTVLSSIAVVLLGTPLTALLALIGIAFRIDAVGLRRSIPGKASGRSKA